MSFYNDALRCESQRLAPEEEYIREPCQVCRRTSYDFIVKNLYDEVVGCDECIKKEYL